MKFKNFLNEKNATLTTTLQEGLHCVGFGISQLLNKKITQEDMSNPDLFHQSYVKYCRVDSGEQMLWNFMINDKSSWTISIIITVNTARKSSYFKKNNYIFYRGMGLMNDIYSQFGKLKISTDITLPNDKWNPSDVWASVDSTIPQFDTIKDLNDYISISLKKGMLIGVSLKKVDKSAKVQHFNEKNAKPTVLTYKGIQKPTIPFGTGITLLTNTNAKIQFRSFNIRSKSDIQGEILYKGASARGGKVEKKFQKKLFNKYKIFQTNTLIITKKTDEELKSKVVEYWKWLGYNFTDDKIQKSWEKKQKEMINRDGYWISILHALELATVIEKNKSIASDFINDIYISASSQTEVSSEYLKIS